MPIVHLSPYGAPKYADGVAVAASVATLAALKALPAADPAHVHGNEVLVDEDQSRWYYHATSTVTGDDILVVDPTNASGRWLRVPGTVDLKLPIGHATADGATLLTMPAGARMSAVMRSNALQWITEQRFQGDEVSVADHAVAREVEQHGTRA